MKFLFHFGMPKAGSTSLQQAVLGFDEIAYLLHPSQEYINPFEYSKLFGIWNQQQIFSDYALDPLDKDTVNSLCQLKSVKTFLVSCENAVSLETPSKCCERVLQLKLPSQAALFIIRKPSDLVRSLYEMTPFDANGNWVSAKEFEEIFITSNLPRWRRYRQWLDYISTIQVHKDCFGDANVHVLRFENVFSREMSSDLRKLANCLQVPADKLYQALQRSKANSASSHFVSIIARRILKDFHLSSFIPSAALIKASLILSNKLAFFYRKEGHDFGLIREAFDGHYDEL